MDFFFNPDGIAVVGATPNPLKGGNAILKNILLGYRGGIFPVNPKYAKIEGLTCYPSVIDIPGPVDLAIVFVPAPLVPAAVEACVEKGVRGIIIESGGFAEAGPEGKRLQNILRDISVRTGVRIWGPNCMGLVDCVHRHIFSFMDPRAQEQEEFIPGTVSLIVQSGMLSAIFLIDIMSNATMGVSKVCSVGNKVDVNECDILEFFLDDPDTEVIGLYLESFSDGRRFLDLCRKSKKPIVILKGGRSRPGSVAALSHTASLAGNQRIIAGALAQTGVREARDFKQMMDLCRSLALTSLPSSGSGRVAVLTLSGGAGIVATDFVAEYGLTMAELSASTRDALERLFPKWMPVTNPIDLWPAMERDKSAPISMYTASPLRPFCAIRRWMPSFSTYLSAILAAGSICRNWPPASVPLENRSSPGSSAEGTMSTLSRKRRLPTESPSLQTSPAQWNAWLRSLAGASRPGPRAPKEGTRRSPHLSRRSSTRSRAPLMNISPSRSSRHTAFPPSRRRSSWMRPMPGRRPPPWVIRSS